MREMTVLGFKHTIKNDVTIQGIGLHTGKPVRMVLKPAIGNTGILFKRTDVGITIPAKADAISGVNHCTNLSVGAHSVRTVEHLMAALHIMGVHNLVIQVDSEELPILDGSAQPYITAIKQVGLKRQDFLAPAISLGQNIRVTHKDKYLSYRPADYLEIEYIIDFPHPCIGRQQLRLPFSRSHFIRHIAPARTFGFLQQVKQMKQMGLIAGANLHNALVFGQKAALNPMRFLNEPIKHKILDFMGDIFLLGGDIRGRFTIYKGGHHLHSLMVQAIERHLQKPRVLPPRPLNVNRLAAR